MRKLIGIGATALSGMGLLGLLPGAPAAHAVRGDDDPKKDVVILKKADPAPGESPELLLRRAYEQLRRLKTERLEDRQKALVDRASEMYRRGLQALKDEKATEAQALAQGALGLATAVDRVRATRETDRPDPDLPPPPSLPGVPGVPASPAAPKPVTAPLPPLPPVIDGQARTIETRRATVANKVYRVETKDGEKPKVYEYKVGDPFPGSQKIELKLSPTETKDIQVVVDPEKIAGLKDKLAIVSPRVAIGVQAEGDPAAARAELKKAYEAVTAARKIVKEGEKRPLLDVAKDLYNTARSAAEAGQNARAIELAKAAVSVTQVPAVDTEAIQKEVRTRIEAAQGAMAKVREAQKRAEEGRRNAEVRVVEAQKRAEEARRNAEVRVRESRRNAEEKAAEAEKTVREAVRKRVEVRSLEDRKKGEDGEHRIEVRVEKTQKDGDGNVEIKVFRDGKEVPNDGVKLEPKDGHFIIRLVPPAGGDKEKEKLKETAPAPAPSRREVRERSFIAPAPAGATEDLVGIGIVLRDDEGKLVVQDLLPNGPAGKDGRIKAGDQVVGIEDKDGKVVEFAGKPLGEVVEMIRGPENTKVKVVVQPTGSVERKTYELTRAKIEVPKDKDEPKESAKPKAGDLPPRIDE
jgi:hypothetical protein